LARLVARWVPHPDLWIYFDAPPEVLQSRKAEVTAQECARQCHAYKERLQRLKPAHIVDAARPLEDVVAEVEDTILEHLEARTLKRLKHGV
jgi:thymidylate kinase